jgi:ABC-type glycerol-3-phosphate transport system permease component
MGLLGFMLAMPFVWMVGASFKSRAEIEAGGVHVVPEKVHAQNYPILFGQLPEPVTGEKLELKFGRWFFNSIFIAFSNTLIQVLTSALAAFAFARLEWRGRDSVFLLYLATMMIPGLMLSIPRALDEAAYIDGASKWQTFTDVILPLARPGLIALALITFIFQYQQFFWPLIMLNDQQFFPLPVGLLELDSTYGQQTELIMAAATITVMPLIVLFVIFQKFLVRGIQLGGVKG